jgi:hypothetical protein
LLRVQDFVYVRPDWLPTMGFLACAETKNACLDPQEKDSLHRTNFKATEKLCEGECFIRPFLVMQPHLTLVGANMRHADAREGWRDPVRRGKYGGRDGLFSSRWTSVAAVLPPTLG